MAWIALALALPQQDAETLSDALMEAGADSVLLDSEAFETGTANVHLTVLVAKGGDAEALLRSAFATSGLPPRPATREDIEDQDWVRRSQSQFPPIHVGGRLWIVPSWHEAPAGGSVVVHLDPGLAFGTGSHPSTRLVLQYLESEMATGARVLDYGCGSGILAIAAAKLGAGAVAATDIDPQALVTSAENAQANGVTLELHELDTMPDKTYDLVLANILATPLIALAPLLAARTAKGGRLVLSGILDGQAAEVAAAYAGAFRMRVGASLDGWSRLDGVRE